MKKKGELAPPRPTEAWTRIDDYLGALARRRMFRRNREPKPRTQPEAPRLLLSTLPFLALIVALGVLSALIFVAAWPGSQPQLRSRPAVHERGYAPKGWFQEAAKEFR